MSALASPVAAGTVSVRSAARPAAPFPRFLNAMSEIGAIFVASTRCAAAVEAGRVPAASDLEMLGITDDASFRHAIGR